jgi:hypothetical protein
VTRGRYARFPETPTPVEPVVAVLDRRWFTVLCDDGGDVLVDLRGWSRPELAGEMAPLLNELVRRMGPSPLTRAVRTKSSQLQRFWTFLDAQAVPPITLRDISPALINEYERWLGRHAGGRIHQRHQLATLIGMLRVAAETLPGVLDQATVARLSYLGHGEAGVSRPRDAYSSAIADRLRTAARSQIDEARHRIAVGSARPKLPSGMEIGSHFHQRYLEVLDLILYRGWADTRLPQVRRYVELARRRKLNYRMEALHTGFYLTPLDVAAFITLLSLTTGMETECLTTLKADCLRNPGKGYVEIEYHKRRSRGSEWKRLRVRDGSSRTPGGLIRLAILLTERARVHLETDRLWALWTINGLGTIGKEGVLGIDAFVRRHELVDDDDKPLKLSVSRLRKTYKADWYRRTGGQLEYFAVGHSVPVAVRHYAEIPALRHVHEQTVADALGDALDAALKPTIVLPTTGSQWNGTEARTKGRSRFDAEDKDLWLTRCNNFFGNPQGSPGEACSTPFWGCLECKNAVITMHKLPALIAFQSFMAERRELLDADEWAAKFGRAWWRVTEQILPSFPETLVVKARADAAAAGPDLIYLPVEARML